MPLYALKCNIRRKRWYIDDMRPERKPRKAPKMQLMGVRARELMNSGCTYDETRSALHEEFGWTVSISTLQRWYHKEATSDGSL